MGCSSEMHIQLQQERQRKQEELLDLPERIDESNRLVGELQTELRYGAETIESVEQQLIESNSLRAKSKDYVLGGIVGAAIGIIFSWLV